MNWLNAVIAGDQGDLKLTFYITDIDLNKSAIILQELKKLLESIEKNGSISVCVIMLSYFSAKNLSLILKHFQIILMSGEIESSRQCIVI